MEKCYDPRIAKKTTITTAINVFDTCKVWFGVQDRVWGLRSKPSGSIVNN